MGQVKLRVDMACQVSHFEGDLGDRVLLCAPK